MAVDPDRESTKFLSVDSERILSKGFEIETEMSIHAVDKNMFVENVIIDYRDRPEGSESKLNTYGDGAKVLMTILRLFRFYRPTIFFNTAAIILTILSVAFFIPVFMAYVETGLVLKFPTLIVCGFVLMAALLSFFAGLILKTMYQKMRQDFEMDLYRVTEDFKRKK